MSTIEKMTIQGIRSFGPDDSEKQMIEFYSPLTLILGPNGTGKTTVIECLKYMTTGVMPPGSKGGAFVHDPKVAHEREVKGQIRLQVKDVARQTVIVQRSLQVTQKLKNITMRTLEGVITRRDAAGEKKSISSKCAEMDREMITSLGVSKPVLENVIFCHQEEANWPLSEGKSLKEKFDAIFASTRYVKALDTIMKLKKTQDQDLKLLRQDITYFKQHKDKAAQLEADMNELEMKLEASKESVFKVAEKLVPIEEKLDQISVKAGEIYKIQTDVTKNQSELKHMELAAEELQKNIENEFQGSTEELKKVLADFQSKVQEREEKLQEYQRRKEDLSRDVDRVVKNKNDTLVDVSKLEQEAQNHEENTKRRDALIRQMAEKYDFDGFSRGEITEEKYRQFVENIREKLTTMVEEGKQLKSDFDKQEEELQQKMDDLRESKTKLEQNERIKKNMMADNTDKMKQINRKLSQVEASAGKLDQLTRELKRADHDLQMVEESLDVDKTKQEIAQLSKEKTKLDLQIGELSSEMNRLHLQSSAQAQLDVLKKDKISKEETIRRLRAKHEDTLSYLMGHMPTSNIRGQLDSYIANQNESVKKLSQDLRKSQTSLSSKEAEKKMMSEQLRKKEDDLKNMEEKIFSVCGSQNFEDGIAVLQTKKAQCQDSKGSLLGAEHFYKKYVEKLEQEEPCCPLCRREFDTEQETKELVLELKEKLRQVPTKLRKAEKDLMEFEKKYDAMMQLKPLRENMSVLEEKEIPETKSKVRKTNEEIEKLRSAISDFTDDHETKEQDHDMAKQIQPDVVLMDRYHGEVTELEKKIAAQAATLSGGDSGRTLQNVINEKEDFQMKVDTITRKLDHKRQKLNDHSDEVQRLKSNINSLREEKLQIDNDLQQRYKLEADKATLLSENEIYEKEIKEAATQIRPIQNQIDRAVKEKQNIVEAKEDQMEQTKAMIDKVKNDATKVKSVNQDMKAYIQSGKEEMLEQKREELGQIEKRLEKKEDDQEKVKSCIEKLNKDLATQQVRERELLDNLALRKKQREIEKVGKDLEELRKKLGGVDAHNLERDRKRLIKQQEDLIKEKHLVVGRQQGFEDQIRALKKELQGDMYRDATQKYRDKMILLRTTELANSDLEKYYKALDKAIMSYHSLKMDEINKIIRELWRNTYRGNDIDTIEIRSDEDDAGIMKTRRTYNYRVVMVKGEAALDMRGRCSAGQKVLASLIIRLALAETFCLNCGVLALDEPTTNLDRENIESLAYALVEIIKSRKEQRNFQLVVITHDEDFVELLGRSDYVDWFFKVRKDQNGCSQLVKAKVQDLHAR
ncbi:DNA repair protein RAD50-like [Pecten maximus]|uniref:DNA repair protein RAD50-like n=1 Tax=Pecten maximus TaxID=6579 RepID=UPI001458F630|nr:DNA repair protein RAD50-like [Pecten maximus]